MSRRPGNPDIPTRHGVAVTTQRGSTSGQRLTYNLKSGQVDSGGAENGGVKMRILPKSQRTQN